MWLFVQFYYLIFMSPQWIKYVCITLIDKTLKMKILLKTLKMKILFSLGKLCILLNFTPFAFPIPSIGCLPLLWSLHRPPVPCIPPCPVSDPAHGQQPLGGLGPGVLLSRQHLGPGIQTEGGAWQRRSPGRLLSQCRGAPMFQCSGPVQRYSSLIYWRTRGLEVWTILWSKCLHQWSQIQV